MLGSFLLFELTRRFGQVRALCRESSDFRQARNVFRLYSADPDADFARIEWVKGDMADIFSLEQAMEGADTVYHCAALMSFEPRNHRKMIRINSSGTANTVNAALKCGVRRFCHVSSIAALGRPENNTDPVNESLLWKASRNNSVYAVSKYEAEREVWRGIAEGLDAVIVNPSIILGYAGVGGGSSMFFETLWKGLRFYPVGVNGFVDVRDVASAMIALAESDIREERFILNADNVPYRKLFALMAAAYGKPGPRYPVGPVAASLAWRAERLRSGLLRRPPILTRETARTAGSKHYYSSEKLLRATGFRFMPIEETVEHHCRNFLKFKV